MELSMPKFAMSKFKILTALAVALCLCGGPAFARHHHHHHHYYDDESSDVASGLAGDTLLIVRHAEKPDSGPGLAPAGEARAKAYADYFAHFQLDGAPVKIGTIIASADSDNSARPRLTVTPFSQASGIKIEQPFPDKEVKALAHWLAAGTPNRTILIAWHHGKLPKLLRELGADSEAIVPGGVWPEDTYDWLVVLKYDSSGNLSEAKKIVEPAFAK
jgi:hypothetical protein